MNLFRTIVILFFLFVSITANAGTKKYKTPEALGTALFNAIKKNDSVAFRKLFFNSKEFEGVIDASSIDPEDKVNIKNRLKTENPSTKAGECYTEIMDKASGWQIDWKNAVIGKIDFSITLEKNISVSTVLVNFTVRSEGKESKYDLTAKECLKGPNGWKMTRNVRIHTKGTDYTNPDYQKAMMDSIAKVMEMDSLMALDAYNQQLAQHYEDSLAASLEYLNYYAACKGKIDSISHVLNTPAGSKCSKWMKVTGDSSSESFILISSKPLTVTTDNRSGFNITFTYTGNCVLLVNIRIYASLPVCMESSGKIMFTFTDGSWSELTNEDELNCYGSFLVSSYNNNKEDDKFRSLKTKKIKSLKVETRDGIFERNFSSQNANDIYELLNCIPRQD